MCLRVERRLADLGLQLPEPMRLPPGVVLPFPWVRVHGDRAFVSGHAPLLADGSLAGPLGKVCAPLLEDCRPRSFTDRRPSMSSRVSSRTVIAPGEALVGLLSEKRDARAATIGWIST